MLAAGIRKPEFYPWMDKYDRQAEVILAGMSARYEGEGLGSPRNPEKSSGCQTAVASSAEGAVSFLLLAKLLLGRR